MNLRKENKYGIFIIRKDFILISVFIFLIDFILEYYYPYVVKFYESIGLKHSFDVGRYIEGKIWLVVFLLISEYLYKKSGFLNAVYLFLLTMVYLPSHILYSYSGGSSLVFYSVITFFVIFGFVSVIKFKIKTIYLENTVKYYILILFSLLLLIPVFLDFKFKINTNVFTLNDIYEVRGAYKSNTSFLTSYFFNWLAKVVIPVILVFSLIKKKYLFAVFAFAVLIYLFLVSGHKSVYLTPLIILFYFVVGKTYRSKIIITLISLSVFLILLNFLDLYTTNNLFKSVFVRRVFFVPSILNEFYFDFFKDSHLYLSHSIFKSFVEYGYDVSPARVIADVYFNKPLMSANNGLISDAYMNFGYAGVVGFSVVFALMFAFLNSINFRKEYFGLIAAYVFTFISSAFLTVILTHGFFIVLIFAFLIFPDKRLKNKIK